MSPIDVRVYVIDSSAAHAHLLVVADHTDERTRIQIARILARADLRLTDIVIGECGLTLFEARGGLAPKNAPLELFSQGV